MCRCRDKSLAPSHAFSGVPANSPANPCPSTTMQRQSLGRLTIEPARSTTRRTGVPLLPMILGAVITTPKIIGNKGTPVRRVVDRAGSMVNLPKLCFCMVVQGQGLAGLFAGTPENAWDGASDLSRLRHIVYKEKPFHTILSCAPTMYDEVWTGGKAMYKLEPVLADDGELIIYAPHISKVCVAPGKVIEEVGYHCRDYFLQQWDRFKHHPWGVLAHCAHVYGLGTFVNGVEKPRARVPLATQIPPEKCQDRK